MARFNRYADSVKARRGTTILSLCVAASLALTACGSASSAGGDKEASPEATAAGLAAKEVVDEAQATPQKITQTNPLGAAVPADRSVVFLANAVPATQIIGDGVEEAVKALGWSFDKVTYDIANPATLKSAFMSALSKRPDAVMVTGVAQNLFSDSVLQAYEQAGVPIVLGGACPVKAEGPVVPGPSQCEGEKAVGRLVANWFIADSGGDGKALYAHVSAYPAYVAYGDAFMAEVEDKCPECEVEKIELTAAQIAENQVIPTAVNAVRSNAGTEYVIFDNAAFAKGIESALSAAGLRDIRVGGRQLDEGALGALQKGDKGSWSASSYPLLGYGLVDAALRAMVGAKGLEGNFVAPIQLITADNAGSVTAPYNEPADALDQYLALWQGK